MVEVLFFLPVVLLMLAGMIGLADLLIAEQKMEVVAGQAGRVAALGGTEEQMRDSLVGILGQERAQQARITCTPLKSPDATLSAESGGETELDSAELSNPQATRRLELIEVRIELRVGDVVVTPLVPCDRNEKLVGRIVVQRQ